MITTETIEDAAGLQQLRDEWDELLQASSSNSFFLTWEWLYPWWKHLSGDRRLFVVTVRSGGQLVAIAPLTSRLRWLARVLPIRTLELLGTDRVCSDHLDLIIRRGSEPEALRALGEHLGHQDRMLQLADVKRNGCLAAHLSEALRRKGWGLSVVTTEVCPFITLGWSSWDAYLRSLDSKHRNDFGRMLRNLSKQFTVRLEQARSEEQRHDALALLVALHNMRWRDRGGSDAFDSPDLVAFHEEVSQLALERGWLRLFVLSLDGQPAASLYGFRHHRSFYFFQSGFNPRYAKHGVGLITLGLTIKSALEEGAEEYDFLRGVEPYKFRWTRETRELDRLELYPPRLAPLLYERAHRVGRSAKRLVRRALPRGVTDRLAMVRATGAWRRPLKSWSVRYRRG